jgi:hypothetical protein
MNLTCVSLIAGGVATDVRAAGMVPTFWSSSNVYGPQMVSPHLCSVFT